MLFGEYGSEKGSIKGENKSTSYLFNEAKIKIRALNVNILLLMK